MSTQISARTLGKFIYYSLKCRLDDIVVPFDSDTTEYVDFTDGFSDAFADQNRNLLRLSTIPGKLEVWFGIKDGEEWLKKVKKPMNERIAALIQQSELRYNRHQSVEERRVELEKFARTVIEESASICQTYTTYYGNSLTPAKNRCANLVTKDCARLIRKNFE